MASVGLAASSSRCATRPKVEEIGLTGYAVPTQCSLLTGPYVMATAERREPCESRGSCPVLGARGGETPLRDSTSSTDPAGCGRLIMSASHRKRQRVARD